MNNEYSSKWVLKPKPQEESRVRLFCFPYAGSSAVVTYKFLVDNLPNFVEVCTVELPGRGTRMGEQLVDNINEIVEHISESMKNLLDKPFMFLGHSMGALISYELTHKIFAKYNVLPEKLYISAHKAPFLKREGPVMHKLDEESFVAKLKGMNGIAKDLLEHNELMDLMLPIIKNDYAVCENYNYNFKGKLDVPITAFGGKYDQDVKEDDLKQWSEVTNSDFNYFTLNGDHFFITKEREQFLKLFTKLLSNDTLKLVSDK